MKGIICERIEKFRYTADLPEPEPGPGEAVIAVRRVGICGTDLHAYRGNQPFFEYPRILGHELAGIVEQVGENDEGIRTGDQVGVIPYLHCGVCIACRSGKTNCCTQMRVMGVHVDGGMRERIAVPTSHLLKTDGLSLDQAAMIEPLAIGAHAIRRAGVSKGSTALVIGGGPIGLGAMTFARTAGAKVIAMDVNEERLAFCRSWAKVDDTIHALTGAKERLAELTDGDYPTFVFDATGNAASMTNAFEYAAHGGTLVYVGLVKSGITFDDPEFHRRELTLMASRNALKEDFAHVVRTLGSGEIDIDRYITHRVRLEDMIEAFDVWLKPETGVIKAIVEL